jgi:hypothetical protein
MFGMQAAGVVAEPQTFVFRDRAPEYWRGDPSLART